MRIIISLIIALLLQCYSLYAQTETVVSCDIMYDTSALKQDFVIFRKAVEEANPSIYRYVDKFTIDTKFDSCYNLLNRSMSEREFFILIRNCLSALHDGHSYSWISEQYDKCNSKKKGFFPLQLKFLGDSTYILNNANEIIPRGSRLVSINDLSINYIKNELFKLLTSDGSILTNKYYELNNLFFSFYFMRFGLSEQFRLTYISPKGQSKAITINAVNQSEAEELYKSKQSENIQPINLEFKKDHIAMLTVKTLSYSELTKAGVNFNTVLDTIFTRIKENNIQNLIIDLRGNGGGRDVYGSRLYSYLAEKDFSYYKNITCKTNHFTFLKYTQCDSLFNKKYEDMLEKKDNTFFIKNTYHPNLDMLKPSTIQYEGKVWFIIDGGTFSAAAEICAVASSNQRAKFVGEETGGGYHGNTCWEFINLELPNTKTSIYIPTAKYEMAVRKTSYADRGILPDYPIQPTIKNILNNEDFVLNYTVELIRKSVPLLKK